MAKRSPRKRCGRTVREELTEISARVRQLEEVQEQLMATAAELTAAVAALTTAVANLPAPAPALITQGELDAAVEGVQAATAAVVAKSGV